jgi:hypothetical protein
VALSELKQLGEQAIVAVAASLVDGGALLKAQSDSFALLRTVNLAPAVRHGCRSAGLACPLASSTAARSRIALDGFINVIAVSAARDEKL